MQTCFGEDVEEGGFADIGNTWKKDLCVNSNWARRWRRRQTYDANLEVVSWAAEEGLLLLDWGFLWGHFAFCADGDGGGERER
jgi:hypothetical protein